MRLDDLIEMKRRDACSPSVGIYLDRMKLGPIQEHRFIEALSEAGQALSQYERALKELMKYWEPFERKRVRGAK